LRTNVVLNATLTVNGTGTNRIYGVVSGAGGLTKTGTGLLEIRDTTPTFTGTLNVLGGTMEQTNTGSLNVPVNVGGAGAAAALTLFLNANYLPTYGSAKTWTVGNQGTVTLARTSANLLAFGDNAVGAQLIITNGGALVLAPSVTSFSPTGGGTGNKLNTFKVVGGPDGIATANWGGKGFGYGVQSNSVIIDGAGMAGGAVVTNVNDLTVANQANTCANSLTITNGGKLFTGIGGDSYLVNRSAAGNILSNNWAVVTGPGSLWDNNGRTLVVANVGASTTGLYNRVIIGPGGVLTNTSVTLAAGAGYAAGNSLLVDGGSVFAKTVTVTRASNDVVLNAGTLSVAHLVYSNAQDFVAGNGTDPATFSLHGNALFQKAVTIASGTRLAIHLDEPQAGRLVVGDTLTITGATLDIFPAGPPGQPVYILATYGALVGEFAATNGVPDGYTLNTSYSAGTAIALLADGGTPPVITAEPVAQSLCSGSTAQFSVTATGNDLSYQWQKNSGNLANGGHFSGVTTSNLTVTAADTGDAGDYRVIVSNNGGSVTSQVATLTVSTPVLAVSPASRDLGGVPVGVTASNTFTVSNTGCGTLNVTVAVSGAFAVAPSGFSVAGGESRPVTVTFTPAAPGGFNAAVIFSSNGGASTNAVSGTGLAVTSIHDVTGSPTISYGTTNVLLTGVVSAAGPIYPAAGETVRVTINGVTSNATVTGSAGAFAVGFPTATIPAAATPYTITYAYAGNGELTAAENTATTLTVTPAALDITAHSTNKTYGTVYTAVGPGQTAFTATGLQNGETVGTVTITASGGTDAAAATGNYTLTPSAATGGTFQPNNYTITYHAGTLTVIAPALQITAATATPAPGAPNALTLRFVDTTGATVSSVTGDYELTFRGLATAADGTPPTVTDRLGAAVPLGAATPIHFTSGESTAGGVLVAYKAEGPVTLHASCGGAASTNTGGAGVTLTIANTAPVPGADLLNRGWGLRLKVKKTDLVANDTDANHDLLSLTSVTTNSANGAKVTLAGNYVYYEPINNENDSFQYTVSDGQGGVTNGTVAITVGDQPVLSPLATSVNGRQMTVVFRGIFGLHYTVVRSPTVNGTYEPLDGYINITTDPQGRITVVDTPPEGWTSGFYRLQWLGN